jgi:hypothetical protein
MTRTTAMQGTGSSNELHLSLELHGEAASTLLRVIATLHRRRCRVLGASFVSGHESGSRLELLIDAPASHREQVPHWLAALIDVRAAEAL